MARKSISSGGLGRANQRKRNSVLARAFFVVLVVVAVVLSGLALHLTRQIKREGDQRLVAAGTPSSGDPPVKKAPPKLPTVKEDRAQIKPGEVDNAKISGGGSSPAIASPAKSSAAARKYPNGPKQDEKYKHDRVYCMVPYVWNAEYHKTIMETWGKRCDVINFFTDSQVLHGNGRLDGDKITFNSDSPDSYKHYSEFPEGTFPDNVIFMNMTRPWFGCFEKGKPKVCRHIWEKMWRSWVYVGDHHLDQADWFCKVDYDTFFFPENLQYYVRDYNNWDSANEHHYFGALLAHKPGRPSMIAGANACWSRKTMEGIAQVYRDMPKGYTGVERNKCEDRPRASEEISTSLCLKVGLNVEAEPARDDALREYVMVDPYHNHLNWNRTEQGEWWFWANKPKNAPMLEECCAIRPMAFHKYKQKELIMGIDERFYGPASLMKKRSHLDSWSRASDKTRNYELKVRAAMDIDQYIKQN